MIGNYEYTKPTTIIFGKDAELKVGEKVAAYSNNCLIVHDSSSFLAAVLDRAKQSLSDAGIEYLELGGVRPNPKLSLMKEGMKRCRERNIGFVLAVGGGSVMDTAKFIALLAHSDGDPWAYQSFTPVADTLPLGCIVTLPGTGSEVSACSMVVNDEGESELKRAFFSAQMKFNFSILNPELTYSLPAKQTAAGGVDIISHYMEAYFTSTTDADMLEGMCEAGINTTMRNLRIALANPKDYSARANMMQAALPCMDGSLIGGTVSDWGLHGLESTMTTLYSSTHGLMLGILTPAWMKYCYKRNVPQFTRFAVNCLGAKMDFSDPVATIFEGIRNFENFMTEIGLPNRLSQIGIDDSKFGIAAQRAYDIRRPGTKGVGFVSQLSPEEVVEIYKLAL